MTDDYRSDFQRDLPPPIQDTGQEYWIDDVPQHIETLPDGHDVLVVGDVEHCKDFCHRQGDNNYGFQGTCGLCSTQDILNQFGVPVSENDVVHYASDHHLCTTDGTDNAMKGGTYDWQQAQILNDYGVPAHVETGGQLEDLDAAILEGRGVIIEVNAGILWNDSRYYDTGQSNHAIVVTGIARDPETGMTEGYYVNDSGSGQAGNYVDVDTMDSMWIGTGGNYVITDVVK